MYFYAEEAVTPQGYMIAQTNLSMGSRWRLEFDFSVEDPVVGASDDDTMSFNVRKEYAVGMMLIKVEDNNPDDGQGELVVRNPVTDVIVGIPGLFDSDVQTTPLTHHIIVDGHWDAPTPFFDIFVTLDDGTEFSAYNVTTYFTAPVQGDSPSTLVFWSTKWNGSEYVVDNVVMGAFTPAQQITVPGGTVTSGLLNGDFEAGRNWGGSTTAPYRWEQFDGSASAYQAPSTGADAIGGSGRSVVLDAWPFRGQYMRQSITETGGEWWFQMDFAMGDPGTTRDKDALLVTLYRAGSSIIRFKIEDDNPDDGTAEVVLRIPAEVDILTVPGLFDADPLTTPLTHQLLIKGHFDDPVPNFDVIITRNDTTVFSALGQTNFDNTPAVGTGVDTVAFFGTEWETANAVIDNVILGTYAPYQGTMLVIQ